MSTTKEYLMTVNVFYVAQRSVLVGVYHNEVLVVPKVSNMMKCHDQDVPLRDIVDKVNVYLEGML